MGSWFIRQNRVKFAYHFHINYDLNLETAEFLALVLCDLVKLWSTQGTNANYMQPRDFNEKMQATAEFRIRPQRGVAL